MLNLITEEKPMGKSLIVGIIMLFLSTVCLPVLAIDPFNVSKNVDEKAILKEKVVDSNREIITFIDGNCNEITIKGFGFIRRAEIWAGNFKTMVTLDGYKFPFFIEGIRNHFSIDYATHIIIPHFIGFRWRTSTVSYGIYAVALGNIEWE
jgi:hypothetical protein